MLFKHIGKPNTLVSSMCIMLVFLIWEIWGVGDVDREQADLIPKEMNGNKVQVHSANRSI